MRDALEKKRRDGAALACRVAALLMFLPLFLYPLGILKWYDPSPGFFVFFAWAALCVAAVLCRRLLIWAMLCAAPIAVLSVDWIRGTNLNRSSFEFFPWGNIALFCGVALVTIATGIQSILVTKADQ